MWYIYIMEYYTAVRNDEIIQFAIAWTELENMSNEVIQNKDKDRMISFIL